MASGDDVRLFTWVMGVGLLVPPAISPTVAAAPVPVVGVKAAATSAAPRPPVITQRRIGFPSSRKRQMAAYSQRHYGEATWRLRPRGIVQHYTGSGSLAGVMATFAANSPDPELGERPGVCAHFVIDTDGSVYQVVSLRIRCRHTVGLNHRMIGVEHVGTSDAAVMSNGRQRVASLRLSAWLVARFGLSTADVIGHNENVRSTLHRERYRPWRCQTHGDFARSTMRDYRARLVRRVAAVGGDTTAPQWRGNRCGR